MAFTHEMADGEVVIQIGNHAYTMEKNDYRSRRRRDSTNFPYEFRLFLIIICKECGAADDASNILTLFRVIAWELPQSVAQDVLLDEKDPWFAKVQETTRHCIYALMVRHDRDALSFIRMGEYENERLDGCLSEDVEIVVKESYSKSSVRFEMIKR